MAARHREVSVSLLSDADRPWTLSPQGLLAFQQANPSGPSRLLVSQLDACTTAGCSCRDIGLRALALEADDNFDPAALDTESLRAKLATGAMNFRLDIDTGSLEPDDYEGRLPLSPDWVDYIASQVDGELLDALHEVWLHAKGMRSVPKSDWEPRDPGDLVNWYEAHPSGRPDIYIDDDGAFLAEDLYCVNPTCTCSEVVIVFSPARARSAPDVGSIRVRVPSLEIIERSVKPAEAALLARLWRAFSARHRRLAERLSQRKRHMAELASEHLRRRTPVARPAARVGRNEPCPCGSGKKYKRCCG